MKHIVVFGAGKSATVLIDYLKTIATQKDWKVTVADGNFEVVKSKTNNHPKLQPIALNIEHTADRQSLIAQADIVISLMPPSLHLLIAQDCLLFNKNLLTASYIDEATKNLANQAKEKGILFLYEMGLDPGIDHMSAMQIIDDIKAKGGTITSFISHCGGLVAPESDDNPWHYKISWNPRNVVMAGKAGATFLKDKKETNLPYEQLFNNNALVKINDEESLAFYPNRDSLSYIETYNLQGIHTFIRTTLRHPEFCIGWKNIVTLQLTNEDKVYETNNLSLKQFFKQHFERNNFSNWFEDMMMTKLNNAKDTLEKLMQIMEEEEQAIEAGETPDKDIMVVDNAGNLNSIDVEEVKGNAAEQVAISMNEANISLKQLFFLGADDDETKINLGLASAADVLQFALEKKLVLKNTDKDMIVMLHEFEYNINNTTKKLNSLLQVIGESNTHTAMAKTVGLPLGIAAVLILENKINETGLHIPILPSIYQPVLQELIKHGIVFSEVEGQ